MPGGVPILADYVVTETYHYEGPEGRLSSRRMTMTDQGLNSGGAQWFDQAFAYDQLGILTSQDYPGCHHFGCANQEPDRQVSYSYNDGFLVGVPGYASELTFHANGALASVQHTNGLTDSMERDPNWIERLSGLITAPTAGGAPLWQSGAFAYDAAGNITTMGLDQFYYDEVSRLVRAEVALGAATHIEDYAYDRFGNLTAIAAASGTRSYPVNQLTNRLSLAGYPYDSAGNLTANPAGTYSYDHLSMVTQVTGTGKNEQYIYTADDERLAKLPAPGLPGSVKWSLRGLGAEVLRTYSSTYSAELGFSLWFWKEDYVYRGSSLLGSHKPDQIYSYQKHFHLDHLGTPRLRTDDIGQVIETHKYLPYGEELTSSPVGSETMRFTGHERDEDPTGFGNGLDYMHARYYSPRMGRFLSLDPVGGSSPEPQSWNRYTYVRGSPLSYTDPTGLYLVQCPDGDSGCAEDAKEFEEARQKNLKSKDRRVRNTALALGDPGKDNGVTVLFEAPGNGAAGDTTQFLQGDSVTGQMGAVATVRIEPGLRGTELASAVAHEGQHVLQGQPFAATFTRDAAWFDVTKNLTRFDSELESFALTNFIFKAANQKFSLRCPGCSLGKGIKTEADRDKAIKKILADPSGPYRGVTLERPGPTMFPNWVSP